MLKIGVLALQGDFSLHCERLLELDVEVQEIRNSRQLENIDGLVFPGGESTTLLKLLTDDMRRSICQLVRSGLPVLATCAGVILLAREVRNPSQDSLALLDIVVERNSYGRQVDSFVCPALEWTDFGRSIVRAQLGPEAVPEVEGVFIRAPRIVSSGTNVKTILECRGQAVLVLQGQILAATFHPEVAASTSAGAFVIHQLFLSLVGLSSDSLVLERK